MMMMKGVNIRVLRINYDFLDLEGKKMTTTQNNVGLYSCKIFY